MLLSRILRLPSGNRASWNLPETVHPGIQPVDGSIRLLQPSRTLWECRYISACLARCLLRHAVFYPLPEAPFLLPRKFRPGVSPCREWRQGSRRNSIGNVRQPILMRNIHLLSVCLSALAARSVLFLLPWHIPQESRLSVPEGASPSPLLLSLIHI